MPEGRLLVLHALTGLHPGSGSSIGFVDLPVQRERHTQWPVIPGSSLKGVLRSATKENGLPDDDVKTLFGPDTANAHEHAGAIGFVDARVLAFPVRSLRGVFAWVTCPAVIERLRRDSELVGVTPPATPPSVDKEQIRCAKNAPLLIDDGKAVMLEEFEFNVSGEADAIGEWIATHAIRDATQKARVALLSDNDFTHFVRYATEVTARIGLDASSKTVREGALFYEEVLPPETVFYSPILGARSRRAGDSREANELLTVLQGAAPKVIQVGADETIGRGFCRLRWIGGE